MEIKMKKREYQPSEIEVTELLVDDILKESLFDPELDNDQGVWDSELSGSPSANSLFD